MKIEQLNARLNELIAQNPDVPVTEIPGYQEAITEYTTSNVSNAVQAEKSKLYGTIDDFKKKNADLSEKNAQLSTQVSDYTNKFQDLSAKVEQFTMAPITSDKYKQEELTPQQVAELNKQQVQGLTPEQVQAMMDKKFNEELPQIIQNSLKPVLDTTANIQQETLQSYKDNRLKELGDSVIPEMVTGNTKEEIEASIEASKAVRTRFATPNTPPTPGTPPSEGTPAPQVQTPTPTPAPTPTPTPPSPTPVTPTPPSSSALDGVKGMNMQDFGQNRDALLKELQAAVNN